MPFPNKLIFYLTTIVLFALSKFCKSLYQTFVNHLSQPNAFTNRQGASRALIVGIIGDVCSLAILLIVSFYCFYEGYVSTPPIILSFVSIVLDIAFGPIFISQIRKKFQDLQYIRNNER